MKIHKALLILLVSAVTAGCSQQEEMSFPEVDNLRETQIQQTTEAERIPAEITCLTSHGAETSEHMQKFRTQLETEGFQWKESEITEISSENAIIFYYAPKEDMTQEEYKILSDYMNQGGDLMIFLPASESETRYKFLNRLLEDFYIQIDYDKITETDKFRVQEDDSIRLNMISMPERMTAYSDTMEASPVYMRNMRSFHLLGDYATDELFIDVILQTADTATGEPFGGTEDDPLTYENEKLDVLIYSRDAVKGNASMIVSGAGDFLLDENFDEKTSKTAQEWIYSSLYWLTSYSTY